MLLKQSGLQKKAELREDERGDRISLGQLCAGFGEVSQATRLDARDGDRRPKQRVQESLLDAAGGLDDDKIDGALLEQYKQCDQTFWRVVDGRWDLAIGVGQVESILGDISALLQTVPSAVSLRVCLRVLRAFAVLQRKKSPVDESTGL